LGDHNTVNLNLPTELANVTSDQALTRINNTALDLIRKAGNYLVVKNI
jgi:hypothetical protein